MVADVITPPTSLCSSFLLLSLQECPQSSRTSRRSAPPSSTPPWMRSSPFGRPTPTPPTRPFSSSTWSTTSSCPPWTKRTLGTSRFPTPPLAPSLRSPAPSSRTPSPTRSPPSAPPSSPTNASERAPAETAAPTRPASSSTALSASSTRG